MEMRHHLHDQEKLNRDGEEWSLTAQEDPHALPEVRRQARLSIVKLSVAGVQTRLSDWQFILRHRPACNEDSRLDFGMFNTILTKPPRGKHFRPRRRHISVDQARNLPTEGAVSVPCGSSQPQAASDDIALDFGGSRVDRAAYRIA